jgi:EF-P beta-lysylation protein EpmB
MDKVLIRTMQHVSTNQSGEILARRSSFVPTASEPENSGPNIACRTAVDWQTAIRRAVRSTEELRQIVGLPAASGVKGEQSFPTFVPWEFLRRIRRGDAGDPLLRQVLPCGDEDLERPGYSDDPVGDLDALVAGGLLHKYHGRALLITTGACGVHCRYCFRREFPYVAAGSRSEDWRGSIDYLRDHLDLEEVLLSGGDPLTLVDQKIDQLLSEIEAIAHIRRLRIHTRMPIVIPQRVTADLVERLASSRLTVWFVVHANHPNELDGDVLQRLGMLIDAGIPVLNQAVLLRGVNDDAQTLIELCRRLVDHRIQPYYLHQLDRVRGASHFEVPVAEGHRLIEQLRQTLPGYAVPTYVVEETGKESKTPLTESPPTAR